MIILQNVCKTYKGATPTKALNNVSLSLPERGMVFVLGARKRDISLVFALEQLVVTIANSLSALLCRIKNNQITQILIKQCKQGKKYDNNSSS